MFPRPRRWVKVVDAGYLGAMKIFITGGSGFVGGHAIRALSASSEILGMARSDRSAEIVTAQGGTPVRCSLDDVGPEHLEDVDAIVHSAAYVEEWGPRERYFRANVDGTRRLIEAAREAGVSRFVHVGTEAAVFDGRPLVQIDETEPLKPDSPFPYSASKAVAEQLVRNANADGFTTVAVRPRMVWGPEDRTILPIVLRILDEGGFWWVDGGRHATSTCHIDNLVAAIDRALVAEGVGGQAFFVADAEDTTQRDFLEALVATAGRELPGRSLPGWLAVRAAWLLTWIWDKRGQPEQLPALTPLAASFLAAEVTVRTERAREHLGWEPVVTREAGLAALH